MASSRLEMKNKMMEFSFKKMGIGNRIKRGGNLIILNFVFGNFLKWMNPLDVVAFFFTLAWFLFDFSC